MWLIVLCFLGTGLLLVLESIFLFFVAQCLESSLTRFVVLTAFIVMLKEVRRQISV